MFVCYTGGLAREGGKRQNLADTYAPVSTVNHTREPWPEFEIAELAKKRLESASKTV